MEALKTDKTRMSVQARSEGDGMENVQYMENSALVSKPYSGHVLPRSTTHTPSNFVPSPIKVKAPKFVPYEPYKAAVSPILPPGKTVRKSIEKNVVDPFLIKPLASKVIAQSTVANNVISPKSEAVSPKSSPDVNVKTVTPSEVCGSCQVTDDILPSSWHQEKASLENRIEQLTKEKAELEAQFNIQTKVNADLKKLLVASLGEDMQAKVQYMSEDKAKLGEHVLLYSQKLSENNEELEKMSVQCDLWKSKFEASSVLVNELAGWKTVLSRKLAEATKTVNCLLDEHHEVHKQLSQTFSTLHRIQEAFDPTAKRNAPCDDNPWNLLQLASATRTLSEDLQFRLLGSSAVLRDPESATKYCGSTRGEQLASELSCGVESLPALAKCEVERKSGIPSGTQACSILPHVCSREPTVNCCRHCSGEIIVV